MKLFVENWRKHLQEQDNIKLQNAILTEISQNDYEMIKNWMVEAGDEAYSFNNLFNGKKRIAIPVETGVAKGPIGKIVNFFQNNGWKIDFKDEQIIENLIDNFLVDLANPTASLYKLSLFRSSSSLFVDSLI